MPMLKKGLNKLMEECGELVQIASKKAAFIKTDVHPDGEGSMKERLEDEIGDVQAASEFVTENLNLDKERIRKRAERKLALFRIWEALPDDPEQGD